MQKCLRFFFFLYFFCLVSLNIFWLTSLVAVVKAHCGTQLYNWMTKYLIAVDDFYRHVLCGSGRSQSVWHSWKLFRKRISFVFLIIPTSTIAEENECGGVYFWLYSNTFWMSIQQNSLLQSYFFSVFLGCIMSKNQRSNSLTNQLTLNFGLKYLRLLFKSHNFEQRGKQGRQIYYVHILNYKTMIKHNL